jgi:hypothetical protein
MNLPSQNEVEDSINTWLENAGLGEDRFFITRTSFQAVKLQFYALGLIRMEMLLRPGEEHYTVQGRSGAASPQPTLCWVLTDAGRAALAGLLAEKRPESGLSTTA